MGFLFIASLFSLVAGTFIAKDARSMRDRDFLLIGIGLILMGFLQLLQVLLPVVAVLCEDSK